MRQPASRDADAGVPAEDRTKRPCLPPDFGQTLARATRHTLIPSLRGMVLPDRLSKEQQRLVQALLRDHDPDFLQASPFADVDGQPIACMPHPDAAPDRALQAILTEYPAHKAWLAAHMAICGIMPGNVPLHEAALHGREGVFALRDLPAGLLVTVFGGMVITQPRDIGIDRRLRLLAECDHYHVDPASPAGCILEGMSLSMKFNTALQPVSGGTLVASPADAVPALDADRINMVVEKVFVRMTNTVQDLEVMVFRTIRPVPAAEQLCYGYMPDLAGVAHS